MIVTHLWSQLKEHISATNEVLMVFTERFGLFGVVYFTTFSSSNYSFDGRVTDELDRTGKDVTMASLR